MKARLLMVTAVGLVMAADAPRGGPAEKDLKALQGTWNLVSAMQDGQALPEDKVKQTTIVFRGHHFLFPGAAEQATSKDGTITLDATKTPKQMDARSSQGDVMLGIYEIEGDRYKVCFAALGKGRPTGFASKPGSSHILQVWVRKKAR